MGRIKTKSRNKNPKPLIKVDPVETDIVARGRTEGSRQVDLANNGHLFWQSTYGWVKDMPKCPEYGSDMASLDDWVNGMVEREPYLAGMISKVVSSYSARGWTLTGGSRAVKSISRMLHDFHPNSFRLPNGSVFTDTRKSVGWRMGQKRKARSFLTKCRGTFVEIQHQLEPRFSFSRGWILSPVQYMYNMDTTLVEWTDDPLFPIRYGEYKEGWPDPSFYHLIPFPSDLSELYRYGSSAAYRNLELAKIMVAIFDWEQGTLDPHFIDGLLLLKGMTTEQFDGAMKARYDNMGNPAKRIAVLADPDELLDAKLHVLRSLPPSFERFVDRCVFLLRAYALNLEYDYSFFFGAEAVRFFGESGQEMASRESAMAQTGHSSFHLHDQEMIQSQIMPDTVSFNYIELDIDKRAYADLNQVRAKTIADLFLAQRLPDDFQGGELLTIARSKGPNLGTPEQFRQLMVDWEIVPPSWTDEGEDLNIDDLTQVRLMEDVLARQESTALIRRVERGELKDDSIVQYVYEPDSHTATIDIVLPSIKQYLSNLPYYSVGSNFRPKVRDIFVKTKSGLNRRVVPSSESFEGSPLILEDIDKAESLSKKILEVIRE